jgi:hypothetical protein
MPVPEPDSPGENCMDIGSEGSQRKKEILTFCKNWQMKSSVGKLPRKKVTLSSVKRE